jgi:hypothetical protein
MLRPHPEIMKLNKSFCGCFTDRGGFFKKSPWPPEAKINTSTCNWHLEPATNLFYTTHIKFINIIPKFLARGFVDIHHMTGLIIFHNNIISQGSR